MVFSNVPYKVVTSPYNQIIVSNGLPNNTFDGISKKKNKLLLPQQYEGSEILLALRKQCLICMKPNKEFIKIISKILNNLHLLSKIELELNLSDLKPNNQDVIVFKHFLALIGTFEVDVIFFPYYYDSRYRIYNYSEFSPTSNRLVRYLLLYKDTVNVTSTDNEFFNMVKNLDMSEFFIKLADILLNSGRLVDTITFKNLDTTSINNKLFFILIALKLTNGGSLNILLDNLILYFKKTQNTLIFFYEYVTSGNDFDTTLQLLHHFQKIYEDNKYSKSDSIEHLYLLYLIVKVLCGEGSDKMIILDVSSSALVLCSLILGSRSNHKLNLSDNKFLKNDPYTQISDLFFKENNFFKHIKIPELFKSRGSFKKPSMTIMYGSTENRTKGRTKTSMLTQLSVLKGGGLYVYMVEIMAELIFVALSDDNISEDRITLLKEKVRRVFKLNSDLEINIATKILYKLFYLRLPSYMKNLDKKCLFIYGGIVRLNNFNISLAYTPSLSRISSRVGSKHIRISIQKKNVVIEYNKLFVESFWDYKEDYDDLILLIEFLYKRAPKPVSISSLNKFLSLRTDYLSLSKNDRERVFFLIIHILPLKSKFYSSFRANSIHSVDALLVRRIITMAKYPLITNHDAFFTTIGNLSETLILYNKAMTQINFSLNGVEYVFNLDIKDNLPLFL
ncbi:MAG: hypothetical protein COB50_05375 [Thiotrichales bacterium]|nr:MAG: hypothetical protein COB50_05375 [Thiotrichales bacterium]